MVERIMVLKYIECISSAILVIIAKCVHYSSEAGILVEIIPSEPHEQHLHRLSIFL